MRPGYHLVRRLKCPVCHYGILQVPEAGEPVVFELLPGGYRRTDLDGFAAGRRVTFLDWRPPSEGEAILARLEACRRRHPRWSLFGHNCEHAARRAFFGRRRSRQVTACAAAAALLVAAVGIVLRR
jgi:hypothetical protein